MTNQRAEIEYLILNAIKYNRVKGAMGFNESNLSPMIIAEANLIFDRKLQDIHPAFAPKFKLAETKTSRQLVSNSDSPTDLDLGTGHAYWKEGFAPHRYGDKPAVIQDGGLHWYKYGMRHRVEGPAILREEGMVYHPFHEQTYHHPDYANPYYIFSYNVTEEEFHKIVTLSQKNGMAVELAFLLVMNDIKLADWDVDNDVPLEWQLKALGSIKLADVVDTWVQTGKSFQKRALASRENL